MDMNAKANVEQARCPICGTIGFYSLGEKKICEVCKYEGD